MNIRHLLLILVLLIAISSVSALSAVTINVPVNDSIYSGTITLNATTDAEAENVTFEFINSSGGIEATEINDTNGTLFIRNFDTTTIPDGIYSVNATAINDSAVTVINQSVNVTIDNTAPTINLNLPTSSNTTNTSFNFNWTVIDNLDSNLTCNLTINSVVNQSGLVSLNNTATNFTVTPFINGSFDWNITCVDTAGNVNTSATRNLVVDTQPPSVTNIVINESDNVTTSTQMVTLNVTVSDALTAISQVNASNGSTVTLTNITATIYQIETNATALGCSEGICAITITATDLLNNVNSSEYLNITVDDTLPSIILNFPTNDSNTTNTTINFNWTATDNLDSNLTCSLNVNSVVNQSNIASLNNTYANFSFTAERGVFNWNITCYDDALNSNTSETRTVTINDTTNPIVTGINSTVTINSSIITWNTHELANSSVEMGNTTDLGYTLSNSTLVLNHSITFPNLVPDTLYYYNITTCDAAGNCNLTGTLNFTTLENSAPVVILNLPTNDSNTTNTSISLNWTATDNTDTNLSCNVTINGVVNQSNVSSLNGTSTAIVFNSEGGSFSWYVTCLDNATNINVSETRTFTINDTTVPNITGINVTSSGTSAILNWSTQEPANYSVRYGNDSSNLSANISSASLTTGNTISLTNLVNETRYYYNITACDSTGNCNTTPLLNFSTTDITSPVITVISPADNANISSANVTINWTVTDNNFNTTVLDFDFGTQINISTTNQTNITITNLTAGNHKIVINATDHTGNNATTTIYFTSFKLLNVSNYVQRLNNQSSINFTEFYNASDTSINFTNNQSVNITNVRFTVEFDAMNPDNTPAGSVSLVNFTPKDAVFTKIFNVTINDSDTNTTIKNLGSTPVRIITLVNVSDFLEDDEYTGKAVINTTNVNYTFVYYCEDSQTCTKLTQCNGNNVTGFDGTTACFTNSTDNVTFYTPHFSSVALSLDNIVGMINVTNTDNSTPLDHGSNRRLQFTASENVTANLTLVFQGTIIMNNSNIGTLTTSFNAALNGNLSNNILANGSYVAVLDLEDSLGNTDQVNFSFQVNDSTGPNMTNPLTPSIQHDAVLFTVNTDEYINMTIRYGSAPTTLYTNVSENNFTLTPRVTLTNLQDETTYYYRIIGRDIHGFVTELGTYEVRTDDQPSSSSPGGGGGGGGGGGFIGPAVLSTLGEEVILNLGFGIYTFKIENGDEHQIKAIKITEKDVTFQIYSDPVNFTLAPGENLNVDVDADNITDVNVRLVSFSLTTAKIIVSKPKGNAITPSSTNQNNEANIPTETQSPVVGNTDETDQEVEVENPIIIESKKSSKWWLWMLIIIIFGGLGTFAWLKLKTHDVPAPDQQLDEYILRMRMQGRSYDWIQDQLLAIGWDKESVDRELLKEITKESQTREQPEQYLEQLQQTPLELELPDVDEKKESLHDLASSFEDKEPEVKQPEQKQETHPEAPKHHFQHHRLPSLEAKQQPEPQKQVESVEPKQPVQPVQHPEPKALPTPEVAEKKEEKGEFELPDFDDDEIEMIKKLEDSKE